MGQAIGPSLPEGLRRRNVKGIVEDSLFAKLHSMAFFVRESFWEGMKRIQYFQKENVRYKKTIESGYGEEEMLSGWQ